MMAYHIESGGKRLLIWADSCVHYVMAVQRPEWHLDVDDDKERAVATRRRILDMVATDGCSWPASICRFRVSEWSNDRPVATAGCRSVIS